MKISDFTGLFQTSILTLKHSEYHFGDYYTFDFYGSDTLWETGEHAIFSFPEKMIGKNWRALSFASNQEEGIIKIGTKISDSPSAFKIKLKDMKPGDTIKIRGPFGSFKIQDTSSPIILIAGGVGIVPMRAFLQKFKNNKNRDLVLIYSSKDGYLFEDEFNSIIQHNSQIKLHYITSRDELSKISDIYTLKYKNNAYYYISGTPNMIEGVTKNLKKNNIKGNKILNDPFYGY